MIRTAHYECLQPNEKVVIVFYVPRSALWTTILINKSRLCEICLEKTSVIMKVVLLSIYLSAKIRKKNIFFVRILPDLLSVYFPIKNLFMEFSKHLKE